MIASLTPYLLAAGGLLIAFVATVFKARLDGARLERAKQLEARTEAIHDKKEKDDEVDSLSPADVETRFRRWER